MIPANKTRGGEPAEAASFEESAEPAVELLEPSAEAGAPRPGKRPLGTKEPIVFKWKIVGQSGNVVLTLFKAVEREEIEAQLERLTKDGYYTNLRILDNNERVEQPKLSKAEAKKAAAALKSNLKSGLKPAEKQNAPAKKSEKKASRPTPPVRSAEKQTAKHSKKKSGPANAPSKRPAKKK